MEGNENPKQRPCPCPSPYQTLLKDVSNFKTPIHSSSRKQLFHCNNNNFASPSPQFFTASKQTPLPPPSSTRPTTTRSKRPSTAAATAARRRLKALELEQAQSARKAQVKNEQSLKSLSKSLATWLNFLLQNPKSCGCKSSIVDFDECVGPTGLGKRESGGICGATGEMWRCPKRHRGVTWQSGQDGGGVCLKKKKYDLLRDSLKEVCSFDDLKERMMGYLSSSGCEEVFDVMAHVVKNIDEGRFKMRAHCPLVTDVGVKAKAIRILMCYNPYWLRIGLHIVFGGDSFLPDEGVSGEKELLFLRMVIEKQFFVHTGLAKAYAYNKKVEGLHRPGYYENLGGVILKRFLLLVLILDRAKSQSALPLKYGIDGADGGSPLLFMAESSIKSSRQMVNDFLPSEVMHGEGNLVAHLAILGYKVSYQQSPLLEYNFSVTDIFVDLQDGVRICRAIQLLLNDSSILTKVAVPSDTSKKSLENFAVALQYLKRLDMKLDDGMTITEDDLADGDKELTISFLWNMFVELQLPLLVNKTILALEIQKIRGIDSGTATITNRCSSPLELVLDWIKAICEKYEYHMDSLSCLVDGKGIWCLLDYYFRKELRCSHSQKDPTEIRNAESIMSAVDYTDAVLNFMLSQKLTTLLGNFPEVLQIGDILEHNGAISDRSVVILLVFLSSELTTKKTTDQLNFHKLLGCGCQSPERRHLRTAEYCLSIKMSGQDNGHGQYSGESARNFHVIKAWWQDMADKNHKFVEEQASSTLHQKSDEKLRISIRRENAAKIVQSYYRQSIERRKFLKMINAVSFLQSVIRAWLMVKQKSVFFKFSVPSEQYSFEKWKHLENIERYVKLIIDRHSFVKFRRSAFVIQRAARIWISWRLRAGSDITRDATTPDVVNAAIVIQKHVRGWHARSMYKTAPTERVPLICQVNSFPHLEIEAACAIQIAWRSFLIRRSLHTQQHAATKIQSHVQAWLFRRKFLNQRNAIIKIQSQLRCRRCQKAFQEFRTVTRSSVIIQSHVRGWIVRRDSRRQRHLSNEHNAATVIQRYFRGWRARSKCQIEMEKACSLSQVDGSSDLETEGACRIHLRNHHEAATKIQSQFRAWLVRRRYICQKRATTKIQSQFRALISQRALKGFRVARMSVIIIQTHVRGWIAWKEARRRRYLIVVLQKHWRGWITRRDINFQRAATKIQSFVRYFNSLKSFHSHKNAAIEIQQFVRGQITRRKHLALLRENSDSLQLKMRMRSVLMIQRWWRSVLLFRQRTKSAVIIQSHIRGWFGRRIASRKRQHIVMIQSFWKGYLARRESQEQLQELRARVQESAKNVDDSMRIINRLKRALSELLNMKRVTGILHICATLDSATKHSEKCCEELVAAGAIGTLLELIHSVSQSIPDQQVLKHALSMLRNISRYPHLTDALIQSRGSVQTVLWALLRNKGESYFVASDVLKKICLNYQGLQQLHRLPFLIKRVHNLVEELTRKAAMEKRNPQGAAVRESTERRLREATELLKLITAS